MGRQDAGWLYAAVARVLGYLADEVNRGVRHCCGTFSGSRPGACLVVGGEALEPRLSEAIQDALQIDTSVGDPLEGVEMAGARESGPGWGVAAGLSLRPLDVLTNGTRGVARRRSDASEQESTGEGRKAA